MEFSFTEWNFKPVMSSTPSFFSYCSPAHNTDKRDTIAVISDYLKHKNLVLKTCTCAQSHIHTLT